jgi:hypothetical protein
MLVHAVLVGFALRYQQNLRIEKRSDEPLLIFLAPRQEVPPPVSAQARTTAEPKKAAAPAPLSSSAKQQSMGDFAISLDAPALDAEGLPLRLGVDWEQEAVRVADAQAVPIFKELKQLCEQAALRGEQPPGCHRYKKPDAWTPEPKKFGFIGGLPYVRLSKRCILGLGFFGCGVGHLPDADGHVFDDMRDPDRPRSSVPDPNE